MHKTSRRLGWLLGAGLGLAALAYGLGYRLPGFDRHPAWQEFPHLTNPRLVVEEIPQFDSIYGHRFPSVSRHVAPENLADFYRTNLHSVRSLGYQITDNDFRSGIRMPLSSWPGVAPMGHSEELPQKKGFIPAGYQYLSLELGKEVGYFKESFSEGFDNRELFYQYNQPRTTRNTLYLRYWDANWRIFYR